MSIEKESWDIAIVGGAGHVGLPLSIVFASKGKKVLIYDINESSFATIKKGEMPFMEAGAEPLLADALAKNMLGFTSDPASIKGVPVIIITIGTPIDEFLHPTLKVMANCIDDLAPYLSDDQLLILRSTVYPGVTDWVAKYLVSKNIGSKVAFCPERIVQGRAVEELESLPQIIAGITPEAEAEAEEVFTIIAPSIVKLSPMEAEFAKLLGNAYRYIYFAVANQFYMMTESAGVDFYKVLDGLRKDYPRAEHIPKAGFAAGPCLLKDTMQLAAFYKNQFSIGFAAMQVNEGLPFFIVEKLKYMQCLEDKTIGLLGMAFKANNDDTRSSLSYKVKKLLSFHAKQVLTTDPHVTTDREILPLEEVLEKSDVIVLCAPHKAYRNIDLKGKPVIDIWGFWE